MQTDKIAVNKRKVTKIMPSDQNYKLSSQKYTHKHLQNEFNYLQAESVTKRLLQKGLIMDEEFELIMDENKKTFPSFLSPLL